MTKEHELSERSVVLLGAFNPAIFQPAWFVANELLREGEGKAADENLQMVHPEFTGFQADWLSVSVTRDRCSFSTTQGAHERELLDLVAGTFTLLSHTPVRALGINLQAHDRMPSEAAWHAIGHRLAPQEPWKGVLQDPGLRSLVMEEARLDGPPGYLRVEVAPSRVPLGVFAHINDHYQLAEADPGVDALAAIDTLKDLWSPSTQRADEIAEAIVSLAS